ncbi:MAG: hypothetical protein ACOYJJ_00595 [Anaerovoracaceae bacterium]|jgi:hypothetical protein
MTVYEILEELEDIVGTASNVPFSNKIMVDGDEILELVQGIRDGLPKDMQDAKWIVGEKERLQDEAKKDYEKIIVEAKKQADYLVDNNDIVLKAKKHADAINQTTEEYSKQLKMKTYEYLDRLLYQMQGKMDDLNAKYFEEMFNNLQQTFSDVGQVLQNNRDEIRELASRTQHDEEWLYEDTESSKDNEEES